MKPRNYLKAGVLAIAAGLTSPGVVDSHYENNCSGTEVSDVCFDLENANVVSSYNAGSEDVFVLLYEAHNTYHVREKLKRAINKSQYRLFLTLEELMHENHMRFIAMEGFDGEFSSDKPYANTQVSILLGIIFEEFCPKPLAERRKLALDEFYNAAATTTASIMFEATYQDMVTLFGMETPSLFYKAIRLLDSDDLEGFNRIAVEERSRAFVDNVVAYTHAHPEAGNVIVINTGAKHQESIEDYLEEKGISYIGLYPDGLAEAMKLIYLCLTL